MKLNNRRTRFLVVITFLFVCANQGSAKENSDESKLQAQDIAVIDGAYVLLEKYGEELWSGWTKVKMPMVYIKESTEFAIGFEKPPSGFEETERHLRNHPVFKRPRVLGTNLAAAFPLDGIPSIVIGTPEALQASPTQWTLTAIHEMFHVLQMNRGSMQKTLALKIVEDPSDGMWQLNFPFPYDNLDVMRLLHLDGYCTYLAVRESEDRASTKYNLGTALDARELLKNWLANETGNDSSFNYSKFQEWKEGIALYTEYRMCELAAEDEFRPSPEIRQMKEYVPYDIIWKDKYSNHANLFKHAGRVARSRLEFYHLGLGKGLALDELGIDWKDSYFAPGVWLDDMLESAVKAKSTRQAIQVDARAPAFKLESTAGQLFVFDEKSDQPILVDFWQPWCPPCLESMPALKQLKQKFDGELKVVGIVDRCSDVDSLLKTIEKHSIEWPTLLDSNGDVAGNFQVEGYPHLFLIDRNGVVKWQGKGKLTEDQLKSLTEAVSNAVESDRN